MPFIKRDCDLREEIPYFHLLFILFLLKHALHKKGLRLGIDVITASEIDHEKRLIEIKLKHALHKKGLRHDKGIQARSGKRYLK